MLCFKFKDGSELIDYLQTSREEAYNRTLNEEIEEDYEERFPPDEDYQDIFRAE